MAEVVFGLEGGDEVGHEVDGFLDVAVVGHFDDGVHAAEGEGDEGGGDAAADVVDGVGVSAGVVRGGFVLDVDFLFLGDIHEPLDDEGVVGGAVGEGGAAAEGDFANFGVVEAGGIGGVGDIGAEADVRGESVGGHFGSVAADFFLDGVEADDGEVGFGFGLGEFFHGLGDDESADAVIDGAADESVLSDVDGGLGIDGGMSDAEAHFRDVFFAGGTDIDPELVDGRGFFSAGSIAEVDGGVADDAGDFSFVTEDAEAAATAGGGV